MVELPIPEAIIRAIRVGAYVEDAAESVGISTATVYNWLARGEEHRDADPIPDRERPFVEFLDGVTRAKAGAIVLNLAYVRKAAQEDWRAAAWYLAVAQPERYGKNRLEIEHKGGISHRPEGLDLSGLSDDEVDQLESLMAKAKGADAD